MHLSSLWQPATKPFPRLSSLTGNNHKGYCLLDFSDGLLPHHTALTSTLLIQFLRSDLVEAAEPSQVLLFSQVSSLCALLIEMVQLLQAVARQSTAFHKHDEFILPRARLQDGTIQQLESVFKASINTPNDIPRENLQPTLPSFSVLTTQVLKYLLLPISSTNRGRGACIPRRLLVRKGQYSCNQPPLRGNRAQWQKLFFPSLLF